MMLLITMLHISVIWSKTCFDRHKIILILMHVWSCKLKFQHDFLFNLWSSTKLTLKKTLCIIINIIQRVYHTWCWSLRALQTVGTEVDLYPRDIWSPLVTIGHMTTWTLVPPPGAIHPFGTSWGAGKRTQYVKEHRGE